MRRHDFGATWQQLLLRPGVNYQASRKLMLTAGYAYVRSYSYAAPGPAVNEHRFWEQAWLRYATGRVRWSTRLRFENRFIGASAGAGNNYRLENRVRAWQQVTRPVSRRVYLTAYDEVWFYVAPYQSQSAFDQNRAYAGVGFSLRMTVRMEMAYMNQLIKRRSGNVWDSNHTLAISLFSTTPLRF